MPVTARRRASLRRPSSTSPGSARRNADTKNLITAHHHVFSRLEVASFLRAVLLGALVGGVAIFLFYPDISSLLERWQNSSEQSGLHGPNVAQKDNAPSNGNQRSVNKEEQDTRPQQNVKSAKNGEPKNSKSRNTKNSEPGHKSKNPTPIEKPVQTRQDLRDSCSCECTKSPKSPSSDSPRKTPKKPKPAKKEKPPKEDLMEEEEMEVVEEEDPVEVQLMEVEEPEEFIDLDDEDSEPSPPTASDDNSDSAIKTPDKTEQPPVSKDGQTSVPSQREREEPLVLTDGQSITFTPVSPGDENIIRFGGRPKPDKEADKQTSDKPKTGARDPTKQNSSAKSDSPNKPSEKKKTSEAASPKVPKTKDSGSKKKGTSKSSKNQEKSKDADLPDEVKNFQPTLLKSVTAKKIFADGRRIPPVELLPQKETNSSVRVFLFNEFLSEAECDGLRRVHDRHVREMAAKPLLCFDSLSTLRKHLRDVKHNVHVTPNDFTEGTKCVNASFSKQLGRWMSGNWSYSTAFYPGESRFSSIFAARVEQAMGLDSKNGGKFQITSYPTGKAYKAHTDCVLEGKDQRDRVATVLVYLDDVQDGGETRFPELGIWVKPRKGRALVWNNMSPEGVCEPHSLHVASKVNAGSKYILIRWYYYKSFYSLGKRPPEPPIPTRPAGTPRVSCDDYDNGSCRWYDEWNNDHLLDYEYKKYTLI